MYNKNGVYQMRFFNSTQRSSVYDGGPSDEHIQHESASFSNYTLLNHINKRVRFRQVINFK